MAKNNYKKEKIENSEKLDDLEKEMHNVKQINYLNLTILLILLAFVIGIVLKQLGF